MTFREIIENISNERNYQDRKWGNDFDSKNTMNDWAAYIAIYLGRAVTTFADEEHFRKNMLKVAALAVAALEQAEYAPRHYDKQEKK